MNDLDLPPRTTLPPEVRDRIRGTALETPRSWPVRYRAPLSVAAAVAVLAVGAVIIGQSMAGTPDGGRPGTTPSTEPTPAVTSVAPDIRTGEDLDHCRTVVKASPRAHEFAPETGWTPVFTAVQHDVRLTAFRDGNGEPGFCEVDGTTVTVSDPNAKPMTLATNTTRAPADISGLYLSPTGLMAGVAQGVTYLNFSVTIMDPEDGPRMQKYHTLPIFQDGFFVMAFEGLTPGSTVQVSGFNGAGDGVADGTWTYDPAKVRPVGATGRY